MSRVFYIFPALRSHLTQTFPEIKWKVKELIEFKMCKKSEVTGFEGRESTSQVMSLVMITKGLINSSLIHSFENPFSPFTAKNSGLKT